MQWHFREKRIGDDISDPITGEFFADGSIENPSTALVREALQNALDAGKDVAGAGNRVRVRLAVRQGSFAASQSAARRWFSTLEQHLRAPANGLKDCPRQGEPCEYLVIEDFGTSGLTGDTESDSVAGARNNFVDFLRSDGRTRKGAGDRGSWGVGKNVFPRASRINAFIAYTIRADDGLELVMGKAILKIRTVNRVQYQPPCYLGNSWRPDEVPKPYRDAGVIDRLKQDFDISRHGEPGLSLVIPWLDPEIRPTDILDAIVHQFYFAILSGSLSVELDTNGVSVQLDDENLLSVVHAKLPEYVEEVQLAAWALSHTSEDRAELVAPAADAAQKWSEDLVPVNVRERIAAALADRARIAVRVPLYVRESQGEAEPTWFDIFLEHHDDERIIRPSFFREQLAISGVKRAIGVPKVRSLVVIDDEPLAKLLRAAEPPNHTDWDMKTANFKHQYRDGNHVITFVKSAVKQLLTYVRAGEDEPDSTIAIDFFGVPESEAVRRDRGRGQKRGDEPESKFEGTATEPTSYTIHMVNGGFVIRPTGVGQLPDRIVVAAAYDVLAGSPWKLYEPADFDFSRPHRSGLAISPSGDVTFRVLEANRLELKPTGRFELRVTGFDPNRDVIVRAYHRKEVPIGYTAFELHEEEEANA